MHTGYYSDKFGTYTVGYVDDAELIVTKVIIDV